jgi:hypothetical protein
MIYVNALNKRAILSAFSHGEASIVKRTCLRIL